MISQKTLIPVLLMILILGVSFRVSYLENEEQNLSSDQDFLNISCLPSRTSSDKIIALKPYPEVPRTAIFYLGDASSCFDCFSEIRSKLYAKLGDKSRKDVRVYDLSFSDGSNRSIAALNSYISSFPCLKDFNFILADHRGRVFRGLSLPLSEVDLDNALGELVVALGVGPDN